MDLIKYEKRKHSRIDTIQKADIFSYPDYKHIGKAYITDIAMGGLKIETGEPLDENEDIVVKFMLPDGQYFDGVRGRIVRANKHSFTHTYGLKFLDLKFKEKMKLWLFSKRSCMGFLKKKGE